MGEIQGMPTKANPLSSFMRQPKIYITLPSRGRFWSKGSIEIPENGELAVYSMTAKDELTFKTPDAPPLCTLPKHLNVSYFGLSA